MANKVDTFIKRVEELSAARVIKRNVETALTGNLPKHKLKRYQSVVTQAHVRYRNAHERVRSLLDKLSTAERSEAASRLSGKRVF